MADLALASSPEEVFFDHIAEVVDHGAIAVMLSIGHRSGLFDSLAGQPPATSLDVAARAGLVERYVREWLAVMVTARIIDFDPDHRTYQLPEAHAACLTKDAPLGNLAIYSQMVALTGSMQERALTAFKTGDGIEYEEFPCFHEIMAEDSEQSVVAAIDDILNSLIPDIVTRLEQGIDVLDAGCGAGKAIVRLAQLFPNSRFSGFDLCTDAIELATNHAINTGVSNVEFKVRDLSNMGQESAFDLVMSFDAVHDTKDPAQLIQSLALALRPGGAYLMQDIGGSVNLENNLDFPFAPFLYTISCIHCMPVSLAQGGAGLGAMWGWETALEMLRSANFQDVSNHVLPHDPMNVWFVSRK